MKIFHIQETTISPLIMIGLAMVVSVASADIVYNDFNGTPLTDTIGMTAVSNNVLFTADLPGDAGFDVYRFYSGRNFFQLYRRNTGTVEFAASVYSSLYYVESLDAGQSWSDWGGGANPHGNVSSLNISTGDAFMLRADPTYIPFRFTDSTDSNTQKYGYIKMSTVLSGSGPDRVVTWTVDG